MSKAARILAMAGCVVLLPALMATGSLADSVPGLTGTATIVPSQQGPHPSTESNVVYSNFGPNYRLGCCEGWTVSGPQSAPSGNDVVAEEFSAMGTFSVGQIDVGVGWFKSGPDSIMVSLWTDNNSLPGTELGSWAAQVPVEFGFTKNGVATISGISGIQVQAGADYFLELSSPTGAWNGWMFNSLGAKGLVEQEVNGGWNQYTAYDQGAFDILGDPPGSVPTPEPASLALLGSGLVALSGFLVRFRSKLK